MGTHESTTPRDFMPGECTGASAGTFSALDQGQAQEGPQLMAALTICRNSCPQQRFCEEQKDEITTILGARGVGRTVVGGSIVNPTKSEEAYAAHLYEPSFTFDLAHVPPDNHNKLELIRQALRVGQISLRGLPAASHADLATHLHCRLTASRGAVLVEKGIEPTKVSDFIATALLRYAAAQRPDDRAFKRRAFLNADEILDAEAIQLILTEDILALKEAGALNPLDIAKYHKPELFLAVLEKYKSGFELTPGGVRSMFLESPFNTLALITKFLAKKRELRAAKDAGRPIATDEIPRKVSPSAFVASKLASLKKEHANIRQFVNKSYMRRYVSDIIKSEPENPAGEIHALHGRIKKLQKEHPDIDMIALPYIAYHYSDDPGAAIEIFRESMAEIDRIHGDNLDLNDNLRRRFAFEHMADAPNVAQEYLERLRQVREICAASSIDATDYFTRRYAQEFKRPLISDEISKAYNKFRLSVNRDKRFEDIPNWLRAKIGELYDEEDHVRVARNAATFVRRKYLETNYMTELTDEGLLYDRIDPKKGAYLAWSEDFTYLKPEEQEVILCAFGLDRLVLGMDADEATLKERFQTADLLGYVDKHLLPHTVYMGRNSRAKDPVSVLELIRRAMRDHPHKGNIKKSEQARVNELFDQLMTRLISEQPKGHDLNDPEVQKRLTLLVRRAMAFAPCGRDALFLTAKEFLRQANEIRALGISQPYFVASGYRDEFCKNFLMQAKRELPEHSKTAHTDFLDGTTTGQAILRLRRYQNVFNTMSLEFQRRRIPPAHCRDMCRRNMPNPEQITDLLQVYDKVRRHFANNREVRSDIIHHYCFVRACDPFEEIDAWRTAISNLSTDYMRRIGERYIYKAALTRRGKDLTDFLDSGLREFDKHRKHYQEKPHPAVDDTVVHHAVFTSGRTDPGSWLTEYIERWQDLHGAENMSDIEPTTLRRIISMHKFDTLHKINGYRKLRTQYLDDPYIEQWMIDEAIQYGVGKAFTSLSNMRKLMIRTEVRLDEAKTFKTSGSTDGVSAHELIGDNAPTVHEQVFGPDDQEAKEQKQTQDRGLIGRFFETAPPMEKAAISIAYNIPWLMPADMSEDDEDKVYSFFNVETLQNLKEHVDRMLGGGL